MASQYLLVIFLQILAKTVLSSGQSCTPRYPASIQGPGNDIPAQAVGDWFVYRQNGDVTVNQRVQIKSYGAIIEILTNASANQQYVQAANGLISSPGVCQNFFWTGFYAANGWQVFNQAASLDNYTTIGLTAYNVLYHDYPKLMILYSCAVAKSDGTCDTPGIYVQTRARPDTLSTSDKDSFDAAVNTVFKDYCITADDLPVQVYDNSKPTCPYADPPPCVASQITGMENTAPKSAARQAAATTPTAISYGSSTSATPSSCKWPVYVPAQIQNFKSATMEGPWWAYRSVFTPEPTAVSMVVNWHIMGNGILPLTNKTGNYAWAEYLQYSSMDDTTCNHGYYAGFLADDGVNVGFRFVTIDANEIQDTSPGRSLTLYQDDKYQVFYGCFITNPVTGGCDSPFAMMNARADPTTWTQSDKDQMEKIFNPIFAPYGCTAQDVPIMPQPTSKPRCTYDGPSPCLSQYIAGYGRNVLTPATTTAAPTSTASGSYY